MKRFNPEKELNKIQKGNKNKIIISVIALLLVIAIGSSYALYQVRYSKRIIYTKVGDFTRDINILAVFVDDVKQDNFPTKDEEVVYDKMVCDNNNDNHVSAHWDYAKWGLVVEATKKAKCNVYFKSVKANEMVVDFAYNGTNGVDGTVQTFVAPKAGRYKLEVWGAQGGSSISNNSETGGLGGYAVGEVTLTKGETLYIGVGGQGENGEKHGTLDNPEISSGGFNGGGNGGSEENRDIAINSGGGGATHIATASGLLKDLIDKKESILIVAGGGGGSGYSVGVLGGSGGGFQGKNGTNTISPGNSYMGSGATQTKGGDNVYSTPFDTLGKGTFGQGGTYSRDPAKDYTMASGNGGGGGFYGGGGSSRHHAGGGGGSGYIGNNLLTNKEMYCYQCTADSNTNTKTISTNSYSSTPTSKYAKQGNGAARITYLGR